MYYPSYPTEANFQPVSDSFLVLFSELLLTCFNNLRLMCIYCCSASIFLQHPYYPKYEPDAYITASTERSRGVTGDQPSLQSSYESYNSSGLRSYSSETYPNPGTYCISFSTQYSRRRKNFALPSFDIAHHIFFTQTHVFVSVSQPYLNLVGISINLQDILADL